MVIFQEVVERLWTDGRYLGGPVRFGEGRYPLFCDIPKSRLLRWTEETGQVSTFRQPANSTNGNTAIGRAE